MQQHLGTYPVFEPHRKGAAHPLVVLVPILSQAVVPRRLQAERWGFVIKVEVCLVAGCTLAVQATAVQIDVLAERDGGVHRVAAT